MPIDASQNSYAATLSYRQGKQWMHDVPLRLVLERKREIIIKKWAGVKLRASTRSPIPMQVQMYAKQYKQI